MEERPVCPYTIEPWNEDHDASGFKSDLESIRKYIQEQAHRDVSSFTSSVFVLVEKGEKMVRGYYSLSSISIIFDGLPKAIQRKLPRYPEMSEVLLGRLGVDKEFSRRRTAELGSKARLGELLLTDAQLRLLVSTKDVGSALLIVDAELPRPQELLTGARDPLPFYIQYGFVPLTHQPRRVIKSMRAIAKEFGSGNVRS